MTLPTQIKCGSYTYTVKHEERLCNASHTRLKGQSAHDELAIKIDQGMTFQHERETLLHEVLHVVETERNLDLSENEIHQMSAGLAAVLVDNPDLARLFLPEAMP